MCLTPFRWPTRRGPVPALLLILMAACSGSEDPTGQSVLDASELRIVDGPVACDSCVSVALRVTGPGVDEVVAAEVVTQGTPRRTVSTSAIVSVLSESPAAMIAVAVAFPNAMTSGRYDLRLRTGRRGQDSVLVIRDALAAYGSARGAAARIWVRTSGVDVDDSLQVVVDSGCAADACAPFAVGPYEAASLSLSPGTYVLRLDGIAPNCRVTNQNPVHVVVTRTGPTAVTFSLECVTYPNPAYARVSVAVSGEEPDQAFSTNCGRLDCAGLPLSPGAPRLVRFLPGSVPILLADVASNCTVEGSNPRIATAGPGETVDVAFRVACTRRPRITAIVQTTGSSLDEAYSLERCYNDATGLQRCEIASLASNDTTTFIREDAGSYVLTLADVARNCTVGDGPTRRFEPGNTSATATFQVSCVRETQVRVTIDLAGAGVDASVQVVNERHCVLDSYYGTYCDQQWAANGERVTFFVTPGPQSFRLSYLPAGCTLTSANPLTFDAPDDVTTDVRFEGTCPPATEVEIRVTATGVNVDDSFVLVNERTCYTDYYYGTVCTTKPVQSGQAVRFTVQPGAQSFRLTDVAPNCALRSPNPAAFDAPAGVTTAIAFNVECF